LVKDMIIFHYLLFILQLLNFKFSIMRFSPLSVLITVLK
jgi:hypothetical protein